MTDPFDTFDDSHRRGRPEIDGSHRKERVDQIIRQRGANLGDDHVADAGTKVPLTDTQLWESSRDVRAGSHPLLDLVAHVRPPLGELVAWHGVVLVDPARIDEVFDDLKAKVKDILGLPPDIGISTGDNEGRTD